MSYSGDPSASDLDEVRFLSGDNDTDEEFATDDEVTYCISKTGNNMSAAAMVCDYIVSKFSREADIKAGSSGELSIKMSQIAEMFRAKAIDIRRQLSNTASPWVASISVTEKEAQEDRTDRVKPAFTRDQLNRKGIGISSAPEWNNDGYR